MEKKKPININGKEERPTRIPQGKQSRRIREKSSSQTADSRVNKKNLLFDSDLRLYLANIHYTWP